MKYAAKLRHVPLAAAAVMLLAMGAGLYSQVMQARQAAEWVLHTQMVLTTIADVREDLSKVTAAQREHTIVGDPELLQARDRSIDELFAQLAQLQSLTSDNTQQAERAARLSKLLHERMRLAFGPAAAGASMPTMTAGWRADIAQAYRVAQDMQAEELRLYKLREVAEQTSRRTVIACVIAVVGFGFLLLIPAYALAVRARRRAEELQERLNDLVSDLPVTVWQMRSTANGRREFLYVSDGVERERGLSRADVLASNDGLSGHLVEEDADRIEAARRVAEVHAQPFDESYRIRMPDGDLRWLHSHATVRKQPDGSLLWHGFWQDVTVYVKLEENLRAANRDMRSFTYTVSHDLRAPLAAVEGFAAALRAHPGAQLDQRGSHLLARIQAGAQRMRDLIDGLFQLGQIEGQELVMSPVNLSQLAERVLQELRDAEPTRQVALQIEPGLHATGDERLIRQVLANLLGNAWKFTAGQSSPRIQVGRTRLTSGEDAYFVRDNGAGFDMNYSHKLFGAFQRLHTASEFPGTGIGLATVRRIVERHGGSVSAESFPGDGACFYFTLGDERANGASAPNGTGEEAPNV